MNIHQWTVGPFAENTYLMTRDDRALLIDPGFINAAEFDRCRETLEREGAELEAVVLTHAHVDHVMGLQRVLKEFDVPVMLSDEDRYLWENFSSQSARFGLQTDPFDFEPEPLPEEEEWTIGPFTFDVRHTPGHAPDHMVLYSADEGVLIAGDTLFKNGIGRTDLYRGSMDELAASIRNKLYTLPDEVRVLPGHGPETTIGEEKRSNPFVTA